MDVARASLHSLQGDTVNKSELIDAMAAPGDILALLAGISLLNGMVEAADARAAEEWRYGHAGGFGRLRVNAQDAHWP